MMDDPDILQKAKNFTRDDAHLNERALWLTLAESFKGWATGLAEDIDDLDDAKKAIGFAELAAECWRKAAIELGGANKNAFLPGVNVVPLGDANIFPVPGSAGDVPGARPLR